MAKLFVGNLSYTSTEEELQELFSQAGTVTSVSVVKDRDTGRSRGFAFVEMASDSEAAEAIRLFNGYRLDNRELKVDSARPPQDRREGGFGESRGGGGYGDRRGGGGGGRPYGGGGGGPRGGGSGNRGGGDRGGRGGSGRY